MLAQLHPLAAPSRATLRRARQAPRHPLPHLALAVAGAWLLALPAARGQDGPPALADVDVSGTWRLVIKGSFDDTTFLPKGFHGKDLVWIRQDGNQLSGESIGTIKPCGPFTAPMTAMRDGVTFSFLQSSPVLDLTDCGEIGSLSLDGVGTLLDGIHGTLSGGGFVDASFIQSTLQFQATLKRISGMRTATDPDGDGPAVPLQQMGSGEPGSQGAHDLAVTRLIAPKAVKLGAAQPALRTIRVQVQNRGQHDEWIDDPQTLAQLVSLESDLVLGDFGLVSLQPKPPAPGKFPIRLRPKQKLLLRWTATLGAAQADAPPAGVPATGVPADTSAPGPSGTWSWSARVDHSVLPGGLADDHPWDDLAPRSVYPPWTYDAYPDGKLRERGVGAKKSDRTFGDPVLTTLTGKP